MSVCDCSHIESPRHQPWCLKLNQDRPQPNTYRLTVDFETDRDEGDLAYWFEGVMAAHNVKTLDLSVYEVTY